MRGDELKQRGWSRSEETLRAGVREVGAQRVLGVVAYKMADGGLGLESGSSDLRKEEEPQAWGCVGGVLR
ncbi:uncharacterized protein A4U43_C02F15250 [Asparagus officinalis]|uniref:Uncharacterized protein n=1 Tax=Asparagus officinalis TaxID=4686 RepID=A0A5P1FNA8_ASPOF|nr:uncharacterized protein A4U43_C02F15250 [Asparagus officinalis]